MQNYAFISHKVIFLKHLILQYLNLLPLKPQAFLRAAGLRTPQFPIFLLRSMLSVISINTSVCLCCFLILSFFFCRFSMFSLHTYTLSPPSSSIPLSTPPSIYPSIHLSIHPSIPFGGTLSGTLGLFIKASKPTASNTRLLERKRGRWRKRERGGGRSGEVEEWWKEERGGTKTKKEGGRQKVKYEG